MPHINIEIKARCSDPNRVRSILQQHQTDFKGIDNQTDTYFNVPNGRLKLRCGNIENALIFYNRPDERGPKKAEVSLFPCPAGGNLREILSNALGVLTTVAKKREIYFIDNVKFHIDQVEGLGCFVEIEAIDAAGELPEDMLRQQCESFMELFGIQREDLIDCSYSDMLPSGR
jgi:predicted adenylyl cyclase CyaB